MESIGQKGYLAYKGMWGSCDFTDYVLSIDCVQRDPFTSPSRLSASIPLQGAAYPGECFSALHRQTILKNYLVRQLCQEIAKYNFKTKGSGKSGLIAASRPGPEILSRTACECGTKSITAHSEAGFPTSSRTINSGKLIRASFDFLPRCVRTAFYYRNRPVRKVKAVLDLVEDQYFIRCKLECLGLVPFVIGGAILSRESGISSRPMKGSVSFQSPNSLRMGLNLPHRGRTTSMGFHRGITLIVGGGHYDKSTLLKALESGIYNHVVGDGREYVITDSTVMKLRAEDDKNVQNVDIPLFINDLPSKKDTHCFSTEDASGSTSQVTAVTEGIEAGSRVFLVDEDTSATNFMVRGDLMQKIISRAQESVTPFIERAGDLYKKSGISTVMVTGSSSAYFYIADAILQMDCYEPLDITDRTKTFYFVYGVELITSALGPPLPSGEHRLMNNKVGSQAVSGNLAAADRGNYRGRGTLGGGRDERIKVRICGKDSLQVGEPPVDLRSVEQLIDIERISTLAQVLHYCVEHQLLEWYTVRDTVSMLLKEIQEGGLATVGGSSHIAYDLSMPRVQEICACINRYRN